MDLSFLIAMKFEMMITLIIFVLLFLKIDGRASNQTTIRVAYGMLVLNLVLGFAGNVYV